MNHLLALGLIVSLFASSCVNHSVRGGLSADPERLLSIIKQSRSGVVSIDSVAVADGSVTVIATCRYPSGRPGETHWSARQASVTLRTVVDAIDFYSRTRGQDGVRVNLLSADYLDSLRSLPFDIPDNSKTSGGARNFRGSSRDPCG